MHLIYVADIHSNAHKLEVLLSKTPSNSFYCFLGDIWDERDEPVNAWQYDSEVVFRTILELQAKQQAVVLQSNHQHKLMRHLLGNKVNMTSDLARTLKDLSRFDAEFIKHWLLSLPYGFSTEINGTMYRAAHAYYVPGMNEIVPSKYARNIALYGLHKQASKERLQWWLKPNTGQPFVRVAGHHHAVYKDEHSIVIDAGCGSGGELIAYAPSEDVWYSS